MVVLAAQPDSVAAAVLVAQAVLAVSRALVGTAVSVASVEVAVVVH